MVLALSIKDDSRALRMDSLLELMSLSAWSKFDVREFVSLLIKVPRYCIGGLVLYGSTVLSKSDPLRAFCLSDVFC